MDNQYKNQPLGKLSLELLAKADEKHTVTDQMREQWKDYESNIQDAITKGTKTYQGDFFVVVETKKERLLKNVIRNYFFTRSTCPTPQYDQVVYRYHRTSGSIEFLWVVPAKDMCLYYKENPLMVSPEEQDLRDYVLAFYDNTLLRVAKKLNNEEPNSPFLIKD